MSKVITRAQVQKNKHKKNLWLIIHDDVYDVTKFIEEHPGGEDTLLEAGGSDATEAFEDVGHSEDARELLKKYKIGTLPDNEKSAKKAPACVKPWMPKEDNDAKHNSVSGRGACSRCNSLESNGSKAVCRFVVPRETSDDDDDASALEKNADPNSNGSKATRFVVPRETSDDDDASVLEKNGDPNRCPTARAKRCRPCDHCNKNKNNNNNNRNDGGSGNWKWLVLAALLIGAVAVGAVVIKKKSLK